MNLASFDKGIYVYSYRELIERKRGKVTVKGDYDVRTEGSLFYVFLRASSYIRVAKTKD